MLATVNSLRVESSGVAHVSECCANRII
jgi:hypothetical protein